MYKIFVAMFITCICFLVAEAEEVSYVLTNYLPLDQGNTWVYVGEETDKDTFIQTVTIPGIEEINGRETVKMFMNTEKSNGIKEESSIYFIKDSGEVKIYKYWHMRESNYESYEPFLLMFPSQLKLTNVTEHLSSFSAIDELSSEIQIGNIEKKITLEGVEDINVKAGEFKNCLKLSIKENRKFNGDYKIIDRTIWLAQNIGMIKEINSIIDFDKDEGERKFDAEMELKNASIGGNNIGEQ